MSNQDQNQQSVSGYVKMLMAPTTLAALRYALVAIAPICGWFGLSGLSNPDKVAAWVNYAQTFGTATLAIITLAGIVVPVVIAIVGVLSATVKKQIARVRELANNPQLASAEAAKALTDATSQLAKSGTVQQSADAVNALVKATAGLDQVQGVAVTPSVKAAVADPSVVSIDEHKIVPVSAQ